MDARWRRIGRFVSERAVLVLGIVAVVTIGLGIGLTRLGFATGQDSYLDSNTATAKANHRYQQLFGGEAMLVLFTAQDGKTVADLFTASNMANFATAEQAIAKGGDLAFSTITPTAPLQWSSDLVNKGVATSVLSRAADRETDPAAKAARAADAQLTLARALAAGNKTLDNPEWVKFLLYANDGFSASADGKVTAPATDQLVIRKSLQAFIPDNHHALMAVFLKGNATLDEQAAGTKLVKDAVAAFTWENATPIVTGTPTFLTEINDYLQGGMMTLGLVAVVVMLAVLALTFGVRWRFLPLAAVLVGVTWGFGAFAYTGTKLSLVTISGLPILIGLGMDFAIQIHNRAQEECSTNREGSAFEETLARLGPPLALATTVAVASFLVMRISKVPMIRDFGVLLAIGIVALVLAALTMTVAILALREKRSPSKQGVRHGIAERIVVKLGALPGKAVVPLLLVAAVAPVVGLLLEHDARIESDPINWANPHSQTIKNARALEHQTGFASTLGVFIETTGYPKNGIFTDEMGSFVHGFELGSVSGEGKLLPAGSSAVSVLSYLLQVPGATSLPPTGVDMLQAIEVAPPSIHRLLVSDDGNAMNVQFNVGPSSLDERAGLVARLESAIANPAKGNTALPAGADAIPAGLARVGVSLLHNLTSGRSAFAYVSLLLVAALLFLRFRNVALSVLAMVPILLAVGLADILVAILNITLSPLTTVGAPLVIALCAEFSILIVARYVEEREHGLSPREAIDHASARTGRAFTASALATIGGFGVLIFSSLPLLRDFGLIVMLKVAVALASALIVVPPMAIWADERGLLGLGEPARGGAPDATAPAKGRRPVWVPATLGVAFGVVGIVLALTANGAEKSAATATAATVPAAAEVATLPPVTTTPPTTTLPPGASTTTLPPGPAEKPAGLVAGGVYDAFVAAGADPGLARCTADALLAATPEDQLLAKGIANSPPSAESAVLVADAANACGVPTDVQDKVKAANG